MSKCVVDMASMAFCLLACDTKGRAAKTTRRLSTRSISGMVFSGDSTGPKLIFTTSCLEIRSFGSTKSTTSHVHQKTLGLISRKYQNYPKFISDTKRKGSAIEIHCHRPFTDSFSDRLHHLTGASNSFAQMFLKSESHRKYHPLD